MLFPNLKSFFFIFQTVVQVITLIFLLYAIESSTGQQLSAEYLKVKLPAPNAPDAYYDGDDTIYVIGGSFHPYNEILAFSITSETVELIGSFPGRAQLGTVQGDSSGNIFYIGGEPNYQQIFKFEPVTNTTSIVATLPYLVYHHTSVKYEDKVYIIGGRDGPKGLLVFDLETMQLSQMENLPFDPYIHSCRRKSLHLW